MARVRGATATKELRKQVGGGKFLTLKDGDEYEVAFAGVLKHGLEGDLGEPMGIEVVWKTRRDGSRYSEEYDPKKHNEDEMKVSFMWNVLVKGGAEDGSEDEMKIFQQGPQIFDMFIKHKDKKGYAYWFTISREGSGQMDTKYSLDREDAFSDEEAEGIKSLELIDLDSALDDNSNEQQQEAPPAEKPARRGRRRAADAARTSGGDDNGKGDSNGSSNGGGDGLTKEQRSKLKEIMQSMSDPAKIQGAFKTRFGVAKLGELTPDQFDDAKTFLENIVAGESNSSGDVDDPFFG